MFLLLLHIYLSRSTSRVRKNCSGLVSNYANTLFSAISGGFLISLCMIVKDEEEWLAQAIESVRSVVGEIVVVDTGSKDGTVELARSLGAEIFFFEWDGDFSRARNFSLEKAKGDWILVLDADEAIDERDLKQLVEMTTDPSICWEFLQRHYTNDHRLSSYEPVKGEFPKWERDYGGFFESNLCRMFPRHPEIRYEGKVHELVEHSIRRLGQHKIQRTPIRIHHYGHTQAVKRKKDKGSLYSPLGEAKLEEEPSNWQAFFEMGVEHNRNGQYQKSVDAFMRSIAMNSGYVPSWVNMGYVLCEMSRYNDAIVSLEKAIELEPESYEAFCNLGVVYMRLGSLRFAQRNLERAIAIYPEYINAICNLGKVYAHLDDIDQARKIFESALEMHPKCVTAKMDLGSLHLGQGNFELAEELLLSAVDDLPVLGRTHLILGELYSAKNDNRRALESYQRFLELESPQEGTTIIVPTESEFVAHIRNRCEILRKELF